MRQRPVLMPGGWPIGEGEREACARALLASGGDFERIYDESELGLDAYVRHIIRVPFFRLAQEDPIVLATGKIQSVVSLLEFYTRLFELTDQFNQASWLVYLTRPRLAVFLDEAKTWGGVEEAGEETYLWFTSPLPILIIAENSNVSGLRQAVAALEPAPESGIIAQTRAVNKSSTLPPAWTDLPAKSKERRSLTPPGNPRIRRNTG